MCRGGGVVSELGLTSLWGKLGDQEGAAVYHPLVFHMLDAGNVARTILCSPLGSHWRERLGRLFGCVAEDVSHFAPFLVALHDVGKAAPDFQKKRAEVWQQITRSGLAELPPLPGNFSHGAEGYAALAGRKRQPGLLARMALLCAPEREGDLSVPAAPDRITDISRRFRYQYPRCLSMRVPRTPPVSSGSRCVSG